MPGMLASCASSRAEAPRVTLRVLNWAPELELLLEQRIAARFEAAHPGVDVVVESVVNNFGEKLVTSIASGAPPDVFLLDSPDIPTFVDRGLVLDLAPYASRVGFLDSAVFPQTLEAFRRGPRLYAFPKDFSPMVVYTNAQVFRRFSVPLPRGDWTEQEFLAAARALTRDTDGDGQTDVYAINYPRQLYEWIPWVWSAGGDILSPDGSRTSGHLDSPATVATFAFLTSFVTTEDLSPPVQYLREGDASRSGRFGSGRQAMLLSGHWALPGLAKYAERGMLELGVAPIPHRAGVEPANVVYVSGWAVPLTARHRRLAVELAAFLSGEEAQRERARTRLGVPTLRRVAEEFAARDPSGIERAFLAQVPRARPSWGARVMDFHEIEEMSFDVMDRHLLRGEGLQAAATDVARRIDEARAR